MDNKEVFDDLICEIIDNLNYLQGLTESHIDEKDFVLDMHHYLIQIRNRLNGKVRQLVECNVVNESLVIESEDCQLIVESKT
jgi:hypothetical protein